MSRTVRGAVLGLALALGSGAAALLVVDRAVGRLVDPRFTPLAGGRSTHETLVRREFRVPVRTNAAGFRGPELPGAKPAGVFRIVVLGDSFTWGYGVRERQAYPARLARLLTARSHRRVEVVNLGLPGAGPLDYRHDLEQTALRLEPDLVLIGLFANDVNDLYQLRRFGARSPLYALDGARSGGGARPVWKRAAERATPNLYALASRALARVASAPAVAHASGAPARPAAAPPADVVAALGARYGREDAVVARYRALPDADRAALDAWLGGGPLGDDVRPVLLLAALVDPDGERDAVLLRSAGRRRAWDETADVLGDMVRRVRRTGARVVLAVLPASEQVSRARWPFLRGVGYRLGPAMLVEAPLADRVRALAARDGAGFVDLVDAFRRHRAARLWFEEDEHWNARGQAFAAARLADAILPEVR